MPPDPQTSNTAEPPPASEIPTRPAEPWGWTRRQRIGLGILTALLATFLLIQTLRRPARLDNPTVTYQGQLVTLPARMDPNTATEAELTRIPHLAEKLSAKIIAYRTARRPIADDHIVFHDPEDLLHVPGLGKATLEQLRPYLEFPEDPPDTQPATAP